MLTWHVMSTIRARMCTDFRKHFSSLFVSLLVTRPEFVFFVDVDDFVSFIIEPIIKKHKNKIEHLSKEKKSAQLSILKYLFEKIA